MISSKSLAMIALPVMIGAFGSQAMAGFVVSYLGPERRTDGHTYLRIPGPSGISHELTSSDGYIKFRVNVKHADGAFPSVGHNSDDFSPNYGNVTICNTAGCDAAEIDAGTEDLNWNDHSKVTVTLQAKTCQLCSWDNYVLSWE